MTTTPIDIPFPELALPLLRVTAGACRLRMRPGTGGPWVSGTYDDRGRAIPLLVYPEADGVHLQVGQSVADYLTSFGGIPQLDRLLGSERPFALAVDAGASENMLDLSGLPLARLDIALGAGSMQVSFSVPNPTRMERLKLAVGAGSLEVHGLANANAAHVNAEGGAARIRLDFDGTPSPEGSEVRIAAALAGVDLRIPEGLAAEVAWANLLGAPHADAGFVLGGNVYYTRAAMNGTRPLVHIRSDTALSGLELHTIPRPPALESAAA